MKRSLLIAFLLIAALSVCVSAQQLTVREIMAEPSIAGMRAEGEKLSPDGSKVAYVRYGVASEMVAFSVTDGTQWPLGGTHWQCPPVWSSPDKIWTFEGSAGGYAWVEKEIETGLRTGRRVQVTDGQSAINDQLECWPANASVASPFFRKVRVETEELSTVLRLGSNELID